MFPATQGTHATPWIHRSGRPGPPRRRDPPRVPGPAAEKHPKDRGGQYLSGGRRDGAGPPGARAPGAPGTFTSCSLPACDDRPGVAKTL
ncbi:hypothetical protein F750_5073 [Streptomyces sp. PAMC 26508]|nr:hypothetical protein F750_5073 [Streptomyces sp. PAMC 26508]